MPFPKWLVLLVTQARGTREFTVIRTDEIYGLTGQLLQWSKEQNVMRPKKIKYMLYSSLNSSVQIDRKYNLKQFTKWLVTL